MANGRNPKRKGTDSGRDQGSFIAIPWSVIDCHAFTLISHPSKSLLYEVARQYHGHDNGRMLLSMAYMKKRGWNSADTLTKAKRELMENGFIYQTVMGHRPNKASWFAVTWRVLDRLPGYDPGAVEGFVRSAYLKVSSDKNAILRPLAGIEKLCIGPLDGTDVHTLIPPAGAVVACFDTSPIPPAGNPLDKPSTWTKTKSGSYSQLKINPLNLFTNLIQ